ncbi:hypothetical protein FBU30_000857 [Linnemannia zychae]|nr:hypothetical protein FBU30_000857 [Linnemannia zychae]
MTFHRWTATTAAAAALLITFPALISGAVERLSDSIPTMDFIVEAPSYGVHKLELNKCYTNFDLTQSQKYTALSTEEDDMAVNFYMDDKCEEYDFSMVSEVTGFQGAFAAVKYVGEYSNAKKGFYENKEFSETVFPDEIGTPDAPEATALAAASGNSSVFTMSNAGLAVGMGIIGTITIAGIVALGVFVYRRHKGNKSRRGDGKAFMSLTGQDDYDEETGLAGENGPHSSALMQSRVGVSFDDERFPTKYRDEEKSDGEEDEVEFGGYPQVPEGPTQYNHQPGTLPQNLRAP